MEYVLTYPNKEVKVAINKYLLEYFLRNKIEGIKAQKSLREALRKTDLNALEKTLKSLFASIPYDWYRGDTIANYEGYYASVVYSFLAGAGFNLVPEDITSKGRIDLTIIHEERVYIIEFKVIELEG